MTYNLHKPKEINICVISVPIQDIVGGDVFLKQFIKILKNTSTKLYVIVGNFSDDNKENIKIINNLNSWYPTISLPTRIVRYILAQLISSIDLIKVIRKCDVVIFYSGTQLYLIPALITKLFRKKLLLVHQGSISRPFKSAYSKKFFGIGKLFYFIINFFEESMFFLSNKILVESESVIKFLGLGKYHRKLCIGDYRCIDIDIFKIKKGLNSRKKIVGYIGHFTEEKGAVNFVKAIPLLINSHEGIEFIMIGTASSTDKAQMMLNHTIEKILMQSNCHDKVRIFGRVDHTTISIFLNEFKLLVLPSVSEGLPGILREAMACGTPVLATSVGGVPDLIEDGVTGFILKNNSPESIALGVQEALDHPNLDTIIENARAKILMKYTYGAVIERYNTILEGLNRTENKCVK